MSIKNLYEVKKYASEKIKLELSYIFFHKHIDNHWFENEVEVFDPYTEMKAFVQQVEVNDGDFCVFVVDDFDRQVYYDFGKLLIDDQLRVVELLSDELNFENMEEL
jgi:hypothetical protein